MKVSLSWLRELVDVRDPIDVARKLTHAGFEVESRTPFGALSGVVAAEVRAKRPHPQAQKLTLVDVFDGRAVTQVVCGAPNVPEPGARVLWARPGARLPDGRTLDAREVRGVMSPGMLCAEDELGLGSSHEGIVVLGPADGLAPGDDLATALGLPDEIWEVNVTPNRADALGHLGIAREIAVVTGAALRAPKVTPLGSGASAAKVQVLDAEGCPRYTALVLEGVKVGPSPLKLRARLVSLGVRALSNVVDATNLALLELGQPLHAFDLDRLKGGAIVVRRAREGEPIVTLDGVERKLAAEDVAICDAERPVAVAGVMGGATSEVSAATTRVLLESAYFAPARIRRTSKRLGLHTEASHRFERGIDPNAVADASFCAAALLTRLASAHVVGGLTDVYPRALSPRTVPLRTARTRHILGAQIDDAEQARVLGALGFRVESKEGRLDVEVPTRRPDLTREIDLIEEVARIWGYDRVPESLPRLERPPMPSPTRVAERTRDALVGLGFDEVVTYAFLGPRALAAIGSGPAVKLRNPLREELSLMRTSLLSGLLSACALNQKRGQFDLRLFEVGEVFAPPLRPLPEERRHVAGILAGRSDGAGATWLKPGEPYDFFDAKGAVAGVLSALGHPATYAGAEEPWLHPGAQARVLVAARQAGRFGELHPDTARAFEIEGRVLVFEIDLDALGTAPRRTHEPLPRFPHAARDLSFFVDEKVSAAEIEKAVTALGDSLCVDEHVLEDYREPGKVPAGKKGMLWSFTWRAPDRTLTDAEVDEHMDRLRAHLISVLRIEPR